MGLAIRAQTTSITHSDSLWLAELKTLIAPQPIRIDSSFLIIDIDTFGFPVHPQLHDTVTYTAMFENFAYHLYCVRESYTGVRCHVVRELSFGEEVTLSAAQFMLPYMFFLGAESEQSPITGLSVWVNTFVVSGPDCWMDLRIIEDTADQEPTGLWLMHGCDVSSDILPFPSGTYFVRDI